MDSSNWVLYLVQPCSTRVRVAGVPGWKHGKHAPTGNKSLELQAVSAHFSMCNNWRTSLTRFSLSLARHDCGIERHGCQFCLLDRLCTAMHRRISQSIAAGSRPKFLHISGIGRRKHCKIVVSTKMYLHTVWFPHYLHSANGDHMVTMISDVSVPFASNPF